MTNNSDDDFHQVGACILHVIGASLSDLSNSKNLVVAEHDDSFDPDGPALFDAQPNGQRYRIGKLKGFIGDRMEARSFWYGLGHRAGIKIVAQSLPDAKLEKGHGWGKKSAIPVLIIVKAQCGVFDVREFKKGEREERDQRPGRAINALLRYCELNGLPDECKPFYNAKALKALAKRPLSLKDLGATTTSGASKDGVGKAKKKARKKVVVSEKVPPFPTKSAAKKNTNVATENDKLNPAKKAKTNDDIAEMVRSSEPRSLIQKRVGKDFDGKCYFGTVIKYDDTKQPPHWHVEYDDGDEEDYSAHDLIKALKHYKKHSKQPR
mmetsp:Transcript_28314/g.32551  ORF Transcript_28314/g.32551 Transcript_28314/m.32551 type:complete len:322 (+) Transcript_28314:236-1201(+)